MPRINLIGRVVIADSGIVTAVGETDKFDNNGTPVTSKVAIAPSESLTAITPGPSVN